MSLKFLFTVLWTKILLFLVPENITPFQITPVFVPEKVNPFVTNVLGYTVDFLSL